jgi:hypothetical protein
VALLLYNTGSLPNYRHKQSKYHGVTKVIVISHVEKWRGCLMIRPNRKKE